MNNFWLHLPPITCDLLKRFSQLETERDYHLSRHLVEDLLDDAGGDQALGLHAEAFFSS